MLDQFIHEGSIVLLYLKSQNTYLVEIQKGKKLHTHKGFILLEELIGKEYGISILSSLGVEFWALNPLLNDLVFKSKRKTQIIYPKDIALIIMFSGIGPGSRVVEAGTGTGALTMALAHYVKPHGKVFSYEIREEFQKNAARNLVRAGVMDAVELKKQDITLGIDERGIDAVILDLAIPWIVIPQAYTALKASGTMVSYSPTIDQVIKTCEALERNEFVFIDTIECLIRYMHIERGKTRPHTLMTGHTGYITHARKTIKKS